MFTTSVWKRNFGLYVAYALFFNMSAFFVFDCCPNESSAVT